jgi:hypothetical protein
MQWEALSKHAERPMNKTVPSSFGLRIFAQLARFVSDSVDIVQRWGTTEARTGVGVVIIEVFTAKSPLWVTR